MFYDYRLYIRSDRHILGEILGEDGGTWINFVTEKTAPLEKWFHLAFVMDRDNEENSGIYINGIRARQGMTLSGWKKFSDQINIDLSNDSNLYLGWTHWAGMYANVIMDELRISKEVRFQPVATQSDKIIKLQK